MESGMESQRVIECSGACSSLWGGKRAAARPALQSGERQ